MPSARTLVVSALLAHVLPGCSGVPDVTFADADAAVGDAAVASVVVDASRPRDAGASYSCPGRPPPSSAGVCCGTRLCAKCSASQCERCEKEGCSSPDVCCAKNAMTSGGSIACQPAATCN